MSDATGAGQPYFICGQCGAPNQLHDTAVVELDQSRPAEVSLTFTDVYALVGGGWRACCDCGLTRAVDTQAAGWSWVLGHQCR